MEAKKFESEILNLKKFYEYYCSNRHKNEKIYSSFQVEYKDSNFNLELTLCQECLDLLNYNISKLKLCPHEEKPRCRKCPSPCYDKEQWKKTSKMMAYSAINFGLSKAKKRFKSFF